MTHTLRRNPDGSLFVAGITDAEADLIRSGRYTPENRSGMTFTGVRRSARARAHVRRLGPRQDPALSARREVNRGYPDAPLNDYGRGYLSGLSGDPRPDERVVGGLHLDLNYQRGYDNGAAERRRRERLG